MKQKRSPGWSGLRNGLIYVADMRNGLYILRPKPGTALSAELHCIGFLEGNSTSGTSSRLPATAEPRVQADRMLPAWPIGGGVAMELGIEDRL